MAKALMDEAVEAVSASINAHKNKKKPYNPWAGI
jgi:hypothetical protein